jgi:hypothetical protein
MNPHLAVYLIVSIPMLFWLRYDNNNLKAKKLVEFINVIILVFFYSHYISI